MIMTRWVCDS